MGFVDSSLVMMARKTLLTLLVFSYSLIAVGQDQNTLEQGIQQREKGNITRSIDIFKRGLEQNPDNLRMKIELASSYLINKNYRLAKSLAEEVLAEKSLPVIVRRNINDFVDHIAISQSQNKAKPFTRRHTVSLYTGYDSNANIAPDDVLLDIGELSASSAERSEFFNAIMYDFSQYKPVSLVNTNNKARSLYHYNGITFYNKNYNGFDDSDVLFVSARAGIKYTLSKNWFTKAKISATYVNLDDRSLFNYLNLSTQGGYKIGKSEFALQLAGKLTDNYQEKHDGRKGHQSSEALTYKYNFSKNMSLNLTATNSDVNLKDKSYAYDSAEYEALLVSPISKNINFSLSTNYSKNKYRGPQKYYLDARRDEIYKHRVKVDFMDVYKDVDLQFSYTYIDRQSNHDINVYDRHEVMLSLKLPFDG